MPEPKPTPKLCCNKPPLVFHDTKTDSDDERLVMCCPVCGKYLDDTKYVSLVNRWNADLALTYEQHRHANRRG